MYYNGIYHLFYQYNPYGAVWGNIVWAHSVSKDLINWKALKPAIKPTKSFDKYGCWSGSATVLPNNEPVIQYTGINDENQTQVQNYAIPANISDPYLEEWIKPNNNPLIIADPSVNKTAFRDPTTAWVGQDGHWRILIGSRRKNRGIAYLYKSKDFIKWVKAKHPLHSKQNTGNWECPDFFSIDKYVPDNTSVDGWRGLRYDYGNFYASKSFFDPSKNRRILWGWSNESDTKMDDGEKGWAGIQSIPRTIWLDPNGKQLLLWPIRELETLRGHKVRLSNQMLEKGNVVKIKGITAAQADVEVVFSFPSLDKAEPFDPSWDHIDAQELCCRKGSTVQGGVGPIGLLTLASKKLEEYTPVFFRVFKAKDKKHKILLCSDASSSSLKKGLYKPSFAGFVNVDLSKKKLSLRSLIDHSVVESFGAGGKVCITSRVYPTLAVLNGAHLYAFNNGSESITVERLDAWSMNSPQMN
ncbi:hypothetical protein ACH5RR_005634 [Cinchona calisaya]|uniref:Beta-fructofuranosidase n=1 Tax=Cinchona calisaya TaxID=153742 RepID=A0ABD3AM15_9GENT